MSKTPHWVNRWKIISVLTAIVGFITLFDAIKSNAAKESVIYDDTQKYEAQVNRIQVGDGIIKVLERHGIPSDLATKAFATHPLTDDFRFIKDNRYLVLKSKIDKAKKIRLYCPYSNNVYTLVYSGSDINWQSEKANLDVEIEYAEGQVEGSLVASITQKIPDDLVAYRFMDAYLLDFNIRRDIQRGARFSLHVERQFDHGQFIRYGEVLNTSLEVKGQREDRSFIRFPGGGAFVDPKGSHDSRPFYAPVNYLKITSTFKPRRFHPIKRKNNRTFRYRLCSS